MDIQSLENYLHNHIPLSRAMGVKILQAQGDGVKLSVPLAPNINHRETAFGGSVSAVAILAAWTLIHVRLTQKGIDSRVVIQRNTMHYERPIITTFVASSTLQDETKWDRFVSLLQRKGRARLSVIATVHSDGRQAGTFVGDFVALGADPIQST